MPVRRGCHPDPPLRRPPRARPQYRPITSRVTNNTASPVRRGSATLYLGYTTDISHVSQVMLDAVRATAGVLADPPASVRVRELSPDDILVEARFWTDTRRSDYLATVSAVRAAIVAALREAAIDLPDPSLRVVVPGSSPALSTSHST